MFFKNTPPTTYNIYIAGSVMVGDGKNLISDQLITNKLSLVGCPSTGAGSFFKAAKKWNNAKAQKRDTPITNIKKFIY